MAFFPRPRPPSAAPRAAASLLICVACVASPCARAQAPPPLTIERAIEFALERAPALAAAREETLASAARVGQAGQRPNPELELEMENWGGSGPYEGFGGAEFFAGVGQRFELSGKRGSRLAFARAEEEQSRADHSAARLDLVRDVRIRFMEALAAQESARIAANVIGDAQRSLESARARASIGGAPAVDVSRAELALEETRVHLARRMSDAAAARARLAATWADVEPTFDRVEGDLAALDSLPTLEWVDERIQESPETRLARGEIALRETELEVERSLGGPDVEVSAGVRRFEEGGDLAFVAAAGLPLPLGDRRSDAQRAARHRIEGARAASRGVEARTIAEARLLRERLAAGLVEARALNDVLLPKARETVQLAETAYERGLFRFYEVLEARRTHFELATRAADTLAHCHILRAELDRLLGEPSALASTPEEAR